VRIDGTPHRTIELLDGHVRVLDQTVLPHQVQWRTLNTLDDACAAIADMWVRGAPLIGVTAAFGVALGLRADPSDAQLAHACERLLATRPTAINLAWALARTRTLLEGVAPPARAAAALVFAVQMADEDVLINRAMGICGLQLLSALAQKKGTVLNILTHCNAGWLATVDRGTATAPIYAARDAYIDLHVWVDETRPRNQGASLTAWELGQEQVPHTLIVDNAGGLLMQQGKVDVVLVGTDRTTANGDVCNKIGTYLKALAAFDNGVPFYVAAPRSSIDRSLDDYRAIPIEERSHREVTHVQGRAVSGALESVQIAPSGTAVANPGFDITPARLVTGLITERGVIVPSRAAIAAIF
jgi:methylthioribose-1-phosphate isomerase